MRNPMGADNAPQTIDPAGTITTRVGVPLMWLGIGFAGGYIACLLMTKPKRAA